MLLRALFVPMIAFIAIYFLMTQRSPGPNAVRGGSGSSSSGRKNVRGWTLVLDLDETLVHTNGDDMTLFRPHVETFLSQVFAWFDKVVVFTAGTKPYADPILDTLEKMSNIKFHNRLYRESCTHTPAGWVKDMTKVQTNLRRLLIVDNTPTSYSLQPQCGVAIPSYWGQKNDVELVLMLSTLFAKLSQYKAQ